MSMNRRACWTLLAVILAVGLSACASKPRFNESTPIYSGTQPVTSLFIYSFLDVREQSLGKNFLRELERQLKDELSSHGVQSRQLSSLDSPYMASFSLGSTQTGYLRTGISVPVAEVIQDNASVESASGASHRLVMFPKLIHRYGDGPPIYEVNWDLIDVRTGRLNWSVTSSTMHGVWLHNDEKPVERAQLMVQGIIEQMKIGRVLK